MATEFDKELWLELADGIKADLAAGETDRETEIKLMNLLRRVVAWRRGYVATSLDVNISLVGKPDQVVAKLP